MVSDVKRVAQNFVTEYLRPAKVMMIFGARRVGKSVLMHSVLNDFIGKTLVLNGEDTDTHKLLEERSIANYRRLFDGIDLFALDEAQHIPDIGSKLKLIVDEVPHIRVIATGSSSFDLFNRAGEPLVGRSKKIILTPFSQIELSPYENALETRQNLETRLIYGSYPETVLMENLHEKEAYLRDLVDAYLLKDILEVNGIKNAGKMRNLIRLVAYQTGNEVSYDELGNSLGLSKNTVEKYLDLLSKVFVVYRLGAYAKNLRKEVTKMSKWYFYDNGIRNAIIGDFSPLSIRQDTGALWESYCISERIKKAHNAGLSNLSGAFYFWRTYDHQEIDLVEETDTRSAAFEFKWGEKKTKIPKAFALAYPETPFEVIHKENYLDFIM